MGIDLSNWPISELERLLAKTIDQAAEIGELKYEVGKLKWELSQAGNLAACRYASSQSHQSFENQSSIDAHLN